MAKQSLIQRAAENNTEISKEDLDGAEELIFDIRVQEDTVEYQNLESEWQVLTNVEEFARQSVNDILESANLRTSQEILDDLEEFNTACSSCWDAESERFHVDYQTDEDGDLKALIVPLSSSISDDHIVQRIHDSDGNFVADSVEDQVNFELYELWNKDMYVEELNGDKVFVESEDTKSYTELFSESVQKESNDFDEDEYVHQESAREWALKTVLSIFGTAAVLVVPYFTFHFFGWVGLSILFLISFFGLLPVLTILTAVLEVIMGLISMSYALKNHKDTTYKCLFETSEVDR